MTQEDAIHVGREDIDIWRSDNQAAVALYEDSFAEHGRSVKALRWGSATGQQRRFSVLADFMDGLEVSVLDVGSGLGDFYAYLLERGFPGHYTGVDATPSLIAEAKSRFADIDFIYGDIGDITPGRQFDYVVASGIFTFCKHRPYAYLLHTARRMHALARKGVILNSLSTWGSDGDPVECQLDPLKAAATLKVITPYLSLRHDYMPHDFTLFLKKDL